MRLDLETNDLNVIMELLSQGPFRSVAPVIQKIQMQVMAQQTPQPEPAPADHAAGGTD
jgi:hypothetical protein